DQRALSAIHHQRSTRICGWERERRARSEAAIGQNSAEDQEGRSAESDCQPRGARSIPGTALRSHPASDCAARGLARRDRG
ncbi:hypothetical protein LTR53_020481, partial [Teratosphaeriaceae sp. CCFEE 6253]